MQAVPRLCSHAPLLSSSCTDAAIHVVCMHQVREMSKVVLSMNSIKQHSNYDGVLLDRVTTRIVLFQHAKCNDLCLLVKSQVSRVQRQLLAAINRPMADHTSFSRGCKVSRKNEGLQRKNAGSAISTSSCNATVFWACTLSQYRSRPICEQQTAELVVFISAQ
eukprot:11212-Heterococcus_DN1.PRE.1